jgi:ApaG protein
VYDSEATTRGVKVSVLASFVPEQSPPDGGLWFFTYRIRIHNSGPETVQLVSRHWIITNAAGHVEEVRGPGVVGEQPVLRSGEAFEYTSFCRLGTPFGTMEGSYEMVAESGARFWAAVAPFSLSQPLAVN